jgi:hypothetical protein
MKERAGHGESFTPEAQKAQRRKIHREMQRGRRSSIIQQ